MITWTQNHGWRGVWEGRNMTISSKPLSLLFKVQSTCSDVIKPGKLITHICLSFRLFSCLLCDPHLDLPGNQHGVEAGLYLEDTPPSFGDKLWGQDDDEPSALLHAASQVLDIGWGGGRSEKRQTGCHWDWNEEPGMTWVGCEWPLRPRAWRTLSCPLTWTVHQHRDVVQPLCAHTVMET